MVIQIWLYLWVIILEWLVELFALVSTVLIFRMIFLNLLPASFIESLVMRSLLIVTHIFIVLEPILCFELMLSIFVLEVDNPICHVFLIILAKFWLLKWWLRLTDWVNLVSRRAIWFISCGRLILSWITILILSGQWL